MGRERNARIALLAVALETLQLAQLPRLELALGVEPVRVVHVGVHLLRFLCVRSLLDQHLGRGERGEKKDALSASSRTMLSATRFFASCLRFSASAACCASSAAGLSSGLDAATVSRLRLTRTDPGGSAKRRRERGGGEAGALGDKDRLVQRLEGLFLL